MRVRASRGADDIAWVSRADESRVPVPPELLFSQRFVVGASKEEVQEIGWGNWEVMCSPSLPPPPGNIPQNTHSQPPQERGMPARKHRGDVMPPGESRSAGKNS